MGGRSDRHAAFLVVMLGLGAASRVTGQHVKLVEREPHPHSSPRPARKARDVPPRTSLYLELTLPPEARAGEVDPESISVALRAEGGEAVELLRTGRHCAEGASGWLRPKQDLAGDGPNDPRSSRATAVMATWAFFPLA
jgi:hypothetical protein